MNETCSRKHFECSKLSRRVLYKYQSIYYSPICLSVTAGQSELDQETGCLPLDDLCNHLKINYSQSVSDRKK